MKKGIIRSNFKGKIFKSFKINQKFTFKFDELLENKVIEIKIETDKKMKFYSLKIKKIYLFQKKKNFTKRLVYKETIITNSLYKSIKFINKPNVIEFARLYGFQVDFQRDVWKDDVSKLFMKNILMTKIKLLILVKLYLQI